MGSQGWRAEDGEGFDLLRLGRDKWDQVSGHSRTLPNKVAAVYKDMPIDFVSFPDDNVHNQPNAWLKALDTMKKGDFVTIFTPDDTHFVVAV